METWLTVKDKAEAIVNEVARNSPKGSYWEQYRETAIFEPVISDRDVLSLCADALNTVEEHADNLMEYVAGLESEVAEYQRLSEELSRLKDYGPMDDVRFQRLQKWTEEHGGFTPYRLHKSEFILGYLKGLMKQTGEQEDSQREHNIPRKILTLFDVPLERCSIRMSDNPIDGRYRFILRVSQAEFMQDWNANRKSALPPTKTICEWVYWQDKSGNIVPVKKETIDNYRVRNKEKLTKTH